MTMKLLSLLRVLVVIAGACLCFVLLLDEEVVIMRSNALQIAVLYFSCTLVGLLLEYFVNIPPLLGCLLTGIALNNINIVEDFSVPEVFTRHIRTIGLCWILLVSGLEIDRSKVGSMSLKLMFFPGCVEAFVTAGVSMLLFKMPFAFSMSLGFILGAVSPAIIIPCMLDLQDKGVDSSITSLLMAAASMDDIVAITGFSICIGIALDSSDMSLALSIFLHGPVTLLLGLFIGSVGGFILAAVTQVSATWQSTAIGLEIAILMSQLCMRINFEHSTALAALSMGVAANTICKYPKALSLGKQSGADAIQMHQVGKDISLIWNIVMRPLLFGTIGAAFDFGLTRKEELLMGAVVVLVGLSIRVMTAYVATGGSAFSVRERLFVAFAWIPKATVQAALCSIPLSMILKRDESDMMIMWGKVIVLTSVLSIIISAPLGVLSIQCFSSRLLTSSIGKTTSSPK